MVEHNNAIPNAVPVEEAMLLLATALEGRLDQGLDMLAAILEEQLQFLLCREATGRGRFPETEAVRTVSWFTGENHPVVAIAEGVGQEAGLGRFARPVDSFQDDEEAGVI